VQWEAHASRKADCRCAFPHAPCVVQKLDTVIGAVPKSTLVTTIDKYIN
jgi:hypothetical protein